MPYGRVQTKIRTDAGDAGDGLEGDRRRLIWDRPGRHRAHWLVMSVAELSE